MHESGAGEGRRAICVLRTAYTRNEQAAGNLEAGKSSCGLWGGSFTPVKVRSYVVHVMHGRGLPDFYCRQTDTSLRSTDLNAAPAQGKSSSNPWSKLRAANHCELASTQRPGRAVAQKLGSACSTRNVAILARRRRRGCSISLTSAQYIKCTTPVTPRSLPRSAPRWSCT